MHSVLSAVGGLAMPPHKNIHVKSNKYAETYQCMHSMQALVHSVLSAVSGCALPPPLVTSISAALRHHKILNARLAKEVRLDAFTLRPDRYSPRGGSM